MRFARAFPPTTRCSGARAAWASRRWSRPRTPQANARDGPGSLALIEIHREDIRTLPDLLNILREQAPALPGLLRRPVLRDGGRRLQGAEIGARWRHRGAAGQRAVLRHSNRRHLMSRDMIENERRAAIPGRGGGGEGLAVRPLRPLDRLPQLRPGHLLRDDRRLCRAFRPADHAGGTARRGGRMVGHARRAIGPRGLAVHPGPGRPAGEEAELIERPPK